MPSADNKRIAKNTLFLYFRMFVSIIVNLYAVRVVWNVLGIDDYGIYNVVGGIVAMFAFLNNAMVASSQRFISFELGKGNLESLKRVFSISVTVHIIIAFVIFILSESIGIWFLNEKLNIPEDRMVAANWVFQCSVISFLINIVSVPYNSCIVAHEHMKAFGYLGILEVFLKLGIIFLLMIIPFDKLITYAVLILFVSLIMRIIYGIYCNSHFEECRYKFVKDRGLMSNMFSFAGWSFIGNLGFSVRDQGLNIVINLFFNVAVNAAKGVANQIGGVIFGFSQSFLMAVNPQITKRYAAAETDSMISLVFSGCKYSAILMMFVVIPVYFTSEELLKLWLGNVAPYTVGFLRLILIMCLIDSMVGPITTALQATGKIKWFQIIVSFIMLSSIPIAWIGLLLDKNPYMVLYVSIATSLIAIVARLILLHNQVSFSYRFFINKVIFRIAIIFILSFSTTFVLYSILPRNHLGLALFVFLSISVIGITTYFFGLGINEKAYVIQTIKDKIKK